MKSRDFSLEQRLEYLLNHSRLFVKTWGDNKSFPILKKFFKIYISDFEGSAELRAKFMETKNLEEVESLVKATLQTNS
jgi:tRNA-dihydrouridine synthase